MAEDVLEDVQGNSGVGKPRGTCVPEAVAGQFWQADVEDELIPVRRIPHRRGREDTAFRPCQKLVAGFLTGGEAFEHWAQLTASAGPRQFDLVVRDVERDDDRRLIVLDRTRQTVADGIYNLWFENGGWAQLSAEVLDRRPTRFARPVTSASPRRLAIAPHGAGSTLRAQLMLAVPREKSRSTPPWEVLRPGSWRLRATARLGRSTFMARGVPEREHCVVSKSPRTWATHRSSSFIGTMEKGRRWDLAGRRLSSRKSRMPKLQCITRCKTEHNGAQRIIRFGWSMGAAIPLQLVARARYHDIVAGVVLESPVLDWVAVIKANCVRSGLPAATGILAIPWLTLRPLFRMMDLPMTIPLRDLD